MNLRHIAAGLMIGACALNGTSLAGPPRVASFATAHAQPLLPHPGGAITLYDQTGNDSGVGFVSQNFETEFDIYDDEAADDFIVPKNARWKITEVDVSGTYFGGSGPSNSQNVVFYTDRKGLPDKPIAAFNEMIGEDTFGSFVIDLGRGVSLKPGHYWVSVQSNQNFNSQGEWGWETSNGGVHKPSVWRNPGDGFETGCTEWTRQTDCFDFIPGDQLFALKGKQRGL